MKIKKKWNSFLSNMLHEQHVNETTKGDNIMAIVRDEVIFEFHKSFDRYKVLKRNLTCHTAYAVYVPPKYYKEVKNAFAVITKDIKEEFEAILNKELSNRTNIEFFSVDNVWSFDIFKVDKGASYVRDEDNPDEKVTYEEVVENFVAVRSEICTDKLYDFTNTSDDDEIRTNSLQPNSKQRRIQVLTMGAIRDLRPGRNGEYEYPIKLNGSILKSAQTLGSKVLATLKIAHDTVRFIDVRGFEYKMYTIDDRNTDFYIGGSSAATSSQGKEMIRLSSETIMSPHLEIKLDETAPDGSFMIRAIGQVRLNRIPLPTNEWRRLANDNLPILLNDSVEIIFNKK